MTAAVGANLHNRNLLRLQLAWIASITGYSSASVGFAVVAFQRDGALGLALMGIARFLAPAMIGPIGGAVADRFSRVRIMVAADLCRTVLLVGVAIPSLLAVPATVYLLAAAVCGLQSVFRPAQAALIPSLALHDKELEAANLVSTTAEGVGIFLGPAIGGFLLEFLGPAAVFVCTALTFAVSAALVASIRVSGVRGAQTIAGLIPMLIDGARTVVADSRLRLVLLLYAAQTFVAGALQSLVVVIGIRLVGAGSRGVGLLVALVGAGALLGALAVAASAQIGMARLFLVGVVLCGAPLVLIAAAPLFGVAAVAMFCIGVGATMADVGAVTVLQRVAAPAMRARVFGFLESILLGALALGASVSPSLVTFLSLRAALLVFGLALPAVVAAAWVPAARLDQGSLEPTAFS
ncbi:MAG: MFS transporter [Acetobacteraceae bacterium]|nr:MFS transporter [Acetobacteraceae bacterium]MBV8937282.1 MFS transporter [Alphaproteobacteria bacterium]